MTLLVYLLGLTGLGLLILFFTGYTSSKYNYAQLSQSFPVTASHLWNHIRFVDLRTRDGIRSIEILREHNGMVVEWLVHTSRGGFRLFRIEERPQEQLTKILVSSTFGVTGHWIYNLEPKPDGVHLTIEETSVIPSLWYRTYLLLRGKNLHLKRELRRIEDFVNSLPESK
jgi:hypothetical protein